MKNPVRTIKTTLNCLATDLAMLADGSWEPDEDSIAASQDSIEDMVNALKQLGILPKEFETIDDRE